MMFLKDAVGVEPHGTLRDNRATNLAMDLGRLWPALPARPGRSHPAHAAGVLVQSPASGRNRGKRMTSRMDVTSASSMTSRSTPIPKPEVGGRPYSRART